MLTWQTQALVTPANAVVTWSSCKQVEAIWAILTLE